MIALAIPVFLACLLEFPEALAAVFAAASRPGAAVPRHHLCSQSGRPCRQASGESIDLDCSAGVAKSSPGGSSSVHYPRSEAKGDQ
jgi:hypothetical protein